MAFIFKVRQTVYAATERDIDGLVAA